MNLFPLGFYYTYPFMGNYMVLMVQRESVGAIVILFFAYFLPFLIRVFCASMHIKGGGKEIVLTNRVHRFIPWGLKAYCLGNTEKDWYIWVHISYFTFLNPEQKISPLMIFVFLVSIQPYTSIKVFFLNWGSILPPLYIRKYCKIRAFYWLIQNQHAFKPYGGNIWTL